MYRRCWRCCGASERLLERRQGAVRIVLHKPSTEKYNDYILRAVGLLGYAAAFLLATHNSKYPVVLGLYSVRYALVLSGLLVVSTGLLVLSVPRWRARFAQGPARTVSRRQAWGLALAGWLALPLSFVLLRMVLPANDDRDLLISFGLVGLALTFAAALWWGGRGYDLSLNLSLYWLVVLVGIQLVVVSFAIGRAPYIKLAGEVWNLGSGVKQFHDLNSFVSISPDRNVNTWMHFFATWPLLGAYQKVFGVGILQARFFYLLLAWLATPFLYFTAKRLYGKAAAVVAAALSIFNPIHFNWTVSYIWVSTAIAIALYYFFLYRDSSHRRRWFYRFLCGFFAVSAVEGHPYGGAFAVMFVPAVLWEYWSVRGKGLRGSRSTVVSFTAGCASYALVYFIYHFVLPGVRLSELPAIFEETLAWERELGIAAFGFGLTARNIWKMAQLYLFTNPYEFLTLIILIIGAFLRRKKTDNLLVGIFVGAMLLIGSQLAHVNEFYWVFASPFVCIGFGALVTRLYQTRSGLKLGANVISIGGIYALLAILTLYTVQVYVSANGVRAVSNWQNQRAMAGIGHEIDQMLPIEDIVVVGDSGYYLGMPHRLNYWNAFSFTWRLPKYWPLDPPQAIIVTLGLDEGYSGLADWLLQYDFQAVACYPVTSARSEARAAILYTLPELNSSVYAQNCSPEMLAWLDN